MLKAVLRIGGGLVAVFGVVLVTYTLKRIDSYLADTPLLLGISSLTLIAFFFGWWSAVISALAFITLIKLYVSPEIHTVSFSLFVAQTAIIAGLIEKLGNARRSCSDEATKCQETEHELRAAKEHAERSNQTKGEFLANMSHELRTPLGVILGYSEIIANDTPSKEEKIEYADAIKRNGETLARLIDDILDLSLAEAQKISIEILPTCLKDLCTVLEKEMTPLAVLKNIRLKVHCADVPNNIRTDPIRLRQILSNLVNNGIKFTPYGGEVSVYVEKYEETLCFVVRDNGKGISTEEAKKLFKPFSQADSSTTRKYGGTGLGLALSKKLAQSLGGDVFLRESVPGKGSTFVVQIHLTPTSLHETKSKHKHFDGALDGVRVLLADDAFDNRLLLKALLKPTGALLRLVEDGEQALQAVQQHDFDVVFLDLQMPIMDGYEACRALRSQGYTKPIIALTAHAMQEERTKTKTAGFDAHVTKPVNVGNLVSAIRASLDAKPS